MCIGGVLGKIASAIGWTACSELARVAYYPFINKMTIALKLPIFVPPPIGVSAGLEVNLNLGDLTPAVYKHCAGQGHKEFNCLQTMFDARGPTGVSIGVDVLIGVKIPVLGEARVNATRRLCYCSYYCYSLLSVLLSSLLAFSLWSLLRLLLLLLWWWWRRWWCWWCWLCFVVVVVVLVVLVVFCGGSGGVGGVGCVLWWW